MAIATHAFNPRTREEVPGRLQKKQKTKKPLRFRKEKKAKTKPSKTKTTTETYIANQKILRVNIKYIYCRIHNQLGTSRTFKGQ